MKKISSYKKSLPSTVTLEYSLPAIVAMIYLVRAPTADNDLFQCFDYEEIFFILFETRSGREFVR